MTERELLVIAAKAADDKKSGGYRGIEHARYFPCSGLLFDLPR